jgi:hypothetical protein
MGGKVPHQREVRLYRFEKASPEIPPVLPFSPTISRNSLPWMGEGEGGGNPWDFFTPSEGVKEILERSF